jgi:hypothetical protein
MRARAIFRPAPATPSHWPLAYRLRKLRELKNPGSGRPAPGLEIGVSLAETAETPAMARPPDTAPGARAGRKGRKGRKPIFRALWRYESIPGGDACDSNAGIADGDTSYCVPSRMACFCCPSTERKKSLVDSRSSTRIASGTPHNFQDARSNPASRLSHPATTRPPRSAQREKMARPSSSSTARRQFRGPTGIGGRGFYGAHLLREAVAKPREPSENSQYFQCGKAANPGQWCLLIPAFCVPRF